MGLLNAAPCDGSAGSPTVQRVIATVGQHWLVAGSFFSPAVLIALAAGALLAAGVPFSVFCIIGYLLFEVAAFTLERNWSQLSILHFWAVAAPICVLQAVLCLVFCHKERLCGLLLSATCLGFREWILESTFTNSATGRGRNRLVAAFARGWAYSLLMCALCVVGFLLVHTPRRTVEPLPYTSLAFLYMVFVPLSRMLLRFLVVHLVGSSSLLLERFSASSTDPSNINVVESGYENCRKGSHPVDALVLFADSVYSLNVLLEVPYAFALLLAPHLELFFASLVIGALTDSLFIFVLDALRPVPWQSAGGISEWAPSYSQDRPAPLFAALTSRALCESQPSEASRLAITPRKPDASDEECMSPRVSLLLDEFDRTLIGSRGAGAGRRGTGVCLYFQQERKLAVTTHAVAATVASSLAVVCVPSLGMLSAELSHLEFVFRAIALLALRAVADALTCWKSLSGAAAPDGGGATERAASEALWDGPRLEFASLRGWLALALITCCSTLSAVATSTLPETVATPWSIAL